MAEAVGLKPFFSIRQYTARIRSFDLEKCWPFSEEDENKSLPQMAWRRHKWWTSELKDVDDELDDDDEFEVPGTTTKKRSIVELFAIAPQIAGRGEQEHNEKDAGAIVDVTKRKRRRYNNNNNKMKMKMKMEKEKWGEMDGKCRGKLTSTSTHPEKDKKNKSRINHRPNNYNKVKLHNKIDRGVSKLVLGSVLKSCSTAAGTTNTKTKQKTNQTNKKKKLHGKSKNTHQVCASNSAADKDEQQPKLLDITKCRRVQHHVKRRVSFRNEGQPESPLSDDNIAVAVVGEYDNGISTVDMDEAVDHGAKREEQVVKPAFSHSLDLNHSLMSESLEQDNCSSWGSLHGISTHVEGEQVTISPNRSESQTFRRQLSPSACISVPTTSAMISESWESSEDHLWNHCAFNPSPYFQVPYKPSPSPFGVRDAESVNPHHSYAGSNRNFFPGQPLNSHGDLIERQAGRTAAFSLQNYIKPVSDWENRKMKERSLLSPRNFPEIPVLDTNVQEQTPQNEYDHRHHAYRLRPAGQIIPEKESSASSDRPTMRLMGQNFTVEKTIKQLHGSEDGKVWTDKEIIAEQKQNGACNSYFSGGVGRSSRLNMDRHLGIEESQPSPMIGNYFHNRLQNPSEDYFSAMNFHSSHGSSSTSSHRYHHHRNQNLTGRPPSSATSHAFLNLDHGRSRARHEFPTHNLQQWLMDTSQNFAPSYHTRFYDQYHHRNYNQHPRTTSRTHNLHSFSTPSYFPPPPPPPPPPLLPIFPMASSSSNIPFIPQFPVVKPDSVIDLENWEQEMSRITCLEERDRIMKRYDLTKKKPDSLVIASDDDVVEVEEERMISAGSELNGGWAQRYDEEIDVGSSHVSTSRFGGPIKLSAGAKHILKPCQKKMDSDNTRLTYSTRPFALTNESAHPVAMKKSARIFQF